MFKKFLPLFLAVLTLCGAQDLFAARDFNRDSDVYRRYENQGDLDYRQNWMNDRNDYLRGESPLTPYHPPGNRYAPGTGQAYYRYNGQVYRADLYDRPYHRGDWNERTNWRYDKDAYLRGTVDQSDYYRAAYGQGINENAYYPYAQQPYYNTQQFYYGPNAYPYTQGNNPSYMNNSNMYYYQR